MIRGKGHRIERSSTFLRHARTAEDRRGLETALLLFETALSANSRTLTRSLSSEFLLSSSAMPQNEERQLIKQGAEAVSSLKKRGSRLASLQKLFPSSVNSLCPENPTIKTIPTSLSRQNPYQTSNPSRSALVTAPKTIWCSCSRALLSERT